MNYLKLLLHNYKYWKAFKRLPKSYQPLRKWPSETYLKYPPTCTFNGLKVLNLGCGTNVYKAPNVINADVVPGNGINLILTSNQIPLESNSVDFIIANHVIEHIPNWFETMKELARVLKPGGILEIWVPPISSDSAFSYRDHLNRIGIDSFAGSYPQLSGNNALAREEFKSVGDFAKLQVIWKGCRLKMYWWALIAPQALADWMAEHLRNVVSEEGYKFVKRPE